MKKAGAAQEEGPGLKPVDSVDPLPRPKGRCYSEKAAPWVFQQPHGIFVRMSASILVHIFAVL
jgi:hypothetical protein